MKTYKEIITPNPDETIMEDQDSIDDISDEELMEILNDQYNNDELTENRLNLIKSSMLVLSGKLISTQKRVESEKNAFVKLDLISKMIKYNGLMTGIANGLRKRS